MDTPKAAVILKRVLKISAWVIGVPIFMLIVLFIVLQFPQTQKFLVDKATSYLSTKIKSKVAIGEINLAFPKSILIKEIYVEDLHHDTLLYSHSLKVDLNLWEVFSHKIYLNTIDLDGLTAHVHSEFPDTNYNYSFILDAFTSPAVDTSVVQPESGTPWDFSIKNVTLTNSIITYHDTLGGINAALKLNNFNTQFEVFDLDKKRILVDFITLKNGAVQVVQFQPTKITNSSSEPFDYEIGLHSIHISEVNASLLDKIAATEASLNIGEIETEIDVIDIAKEKFALKNFSMSESKISYIQKKNLPITKNSDTIVVKSGSANSWLFTLAKLDLKNNEINYSDFNAIPVKEGFDPGYISAVHVNMNGTNFLVSSDKIDLELHQMSFEERSGLTLKNFKTKLKFDSRHLELSDLDLETGHSRLKDYLSLSFNDINNFSDSLEKVLIDVHCNQSSIAIADVLLFVPDLLKDSNLVNNKTTIIGLNTRITGNVDDLNIEHFELNTQKTTAIKLQGIIKNIRNPEQMYAEIKSFEMNTSKDDIYQVVNARSLPQSIEIPSKLAIQGKFKGFIKNFDASLNLQSSIGGMQATVLMNPSAGNIEQPYDGTLQCMGFDFGILLKQKKNLGAFTLTAHIVGQGLDTSNLNATLNANISKASINGYEYKNFTIDGLLNKQSFTGKSSIKDTNLVFAFDGLIDIDANHPRYQFTFDLQGADLQALHFTDAPLRLQLLAASDLHGSLNENIEGRASLKNILLLQGDKKYPVDSIVFISTSHDSISDLSLQSEILTTSLQGKIVMNELPEILAAHFRSYLEMPADSQTQKLSPQQFVFKMELIDPTLFTENLIPGLEKLTPSSFSGSFDSKAKIAMMKLDIPQVIYSGITIDSLKINILSDAEKLSYSLGIVELSNTSLKFENLNLSGGIKNAILDFQFNSTRDDSTKVLAIRGIIKSIKNEYQITLNPEIILNDTIWKMNPQNSLLLGSKGILANEVNLKNANQELGVNSLEPKQGAPLEIKFTEFNISTFTKIIENKEELATGIINGNLVLENLNGVSAFTSDIRITDLIVQSHPIGNMVLRANNTGSSDNFNVDLTINGNENNLALQGNYLTSSQTNSLNFLLDIKQLNLASLEPLMFGMATRLSGNLDGKLKINGTPSHPAIAGILNTKSCAVNPTIIDSYLKIEDAALVFESKKVKFNSLTLLDTLNNKAVINGYADIENLSEIHFDLYLKTTNFLALNTTREDNPLYFGTVYLNSDMHIKGTANEPVISLTALLNKGTVLTYATPIDEVNTNESEGIVEFVDTIYTNKTIMTRTTAIKAPSKILGIELDAKIDFDKNAELRMLVDPISGDSVYVKGSGLLNFSMDKNGNMTLIGKYAINDGGYHLSINEFVRRDFKIEPGSNITWSGDIMDAYVDMSAVYETRTAPLNLVQNELAGMDELQKNKYRTLQKFLVYLKMNGFISSPQISFDIQLPPGDRGVLNGVLSAKLGELRVDENQLNKQVFALLTLNRFIGQDPLEDASQSSLTSVSRTSASRVLTQQLSNLSARYVKGVDLNLGVNSFEDYSSGAQAGRTQLQIGLSKQLLNDRITIQVGGNVELEGVKAKQNNASDIAGNISVEYRVTDDGRYRLKVYRETQYENPIEGEVTKSAAGIIYKREFTSFKELFKSSKKKNKTVESK